MKSQSNIRYAKISLKRRQRLISLVDISQISIARAARLLGIKNSTAKLIVKRYRQDRTYFQSRKARLKRLLKEKAQLNSSIQLENRENSHSNIQLNEYLWPRLPIETINGIPNQPGFNFPVIYPTVQSNNVWICWIGVRSPQYGEHQ